MDTKNTKNERPILFSAPMVRAILEGRKTQTRRIIKVPRWALAGQMECDGTEPFWPMCQDSYGDFFPVKCPYGRPGDRLWVRETWRVDGVGNGALKMQPDDPAVLDGLSFRSDMIGDRSCDECKWIPSIFMPRWASRLMLEIVSVRVERLQDISNEDVRAEGAAVLGCVTHRINYETLWESINGPGSWGANPWVWVVEFRRIKQ